MVQGGRERVRGAVGRMRADARGAGDERVRLVRVIARLNIGGPALHVTVLTEQLDPARYDSLLVTGVESAQEGNYLALRGKPLPGVVVLPSLGREISGARDIVTLVKLVALMRRVRPHIVHTHTAKAGTLGRLAARIVRVPVIVHTYHGHVFSGYFSPSRTRVLVAIERWLSRHTDCLVTVSARVRDELLALGIGTCDRFRVVPLGLDLEPFLSCETLRGELHEELSIPGDCPLVGIVARLVPIKAHEVFLEAARRLIGEWPAARFLIIGDGERRAELEALSERLGLAGRTHFLGWRRDLDRVYADLDVVVLTSRNEGSPLSLIEAMAAARPVVATRVGGVPDVVVDGVTGHLVPADDAPAVAAAVGGLLRAPDLRRAMGGASRRRAYPAFSARRLVADVERLYEELLARG
jgi:glycosyltransferase involved in cell wall biosynthesis